MRFDTTMSWVRAITLNQYVLKFPEDILLLHIKEGEPINEIDLRSLDVDGDRDVVDDHVLNRKIKEIFDIDVNNTTMLNRTRNNNDHILQSNDGPLRLPNNNNQGGVSKSVDQSNIKPYVPLNNVDPNERYPQKGRRRFDFGKRDEQKPTPLAQAEAIPSKNLKEKDKGETKEPNFQIIPLDQLASAAMSKRTSNNKKQVLSYNFII
eukprot:TRINITY_DN3544_c0_g1_i11.p1 TRINITY_DN3544_c0_g1~~TRINITY_DN3544_c0_g1_i11.p1  ORF type:complete len:207 (+),score=36.73 TRINITY_DN3544_c0_g1_i11:327-947(+)